MLRMQSPMFIENRGQFDHRAKFQVKGDGPTLWLTEHGIVFDLVRPAKTNQKSGTAAIRDLHRGTRPLSISQSREASSSAESDLMEHLVVTQKLVGGNAHPVIEGRNPMPGTYNYFIGSDPDKWQTRHSSLPGSCL